MILSEKIIQLRKKKNWSQEDLAEQLNVSRQSVSKWEGGASIPDLNKIIKLSQLFDVSTDFLLKDEYDIDYSEPVAEQSDYFEKEKTPCIQISSETANEWLELKKKTSIYTAIATVLCILSPTALIFLAGLSEYSFFPISEGIAAGIGITVLLLMVACATAIYIVTDNKLEPFKFLSTEEFELEYGVSGIIEKKMQNYQSRYTLGTALGVILCIISTIPLILSAMLEAHSLVILGCVDILLAIVSIAVAIFIHTGTINESYCQLLQIKEYTKKEKKQAKKKNAFSSIYWCLMTAIYLGISFLTMDWHRTWIIWPCAGVLYGGISAVIGIIGKNMDSLQ